jgi:hypothetical protein
MQQRKHPVVLGELQDLYPIESMLELIPDQIRSPLQITHAAAGQQRLEFWERRRGRLFNLFGR